MLFRILENILVDYQIAMLSVLCAWIVTFWALSKNFYLMIKEESLLLMMRFQKGKSEELALLLPLVMWLFHVYL